MIRDPVSGIRVLDSTVDYADGAEDRLLEIFAETSDLSSLSDELAAHIDDWPTQYHLAHERSNLLRPLGLGPHLRVLEIGAGTGAVSRFMGETGARVVALEGSLARSRAAASRCRDLDNVEVVCGSLEAFEDADGFDLICLIGVLEYAGIGSSGTRPEFFLGQAAGHLRTGGSLVVAIENQLGLKYLLGYEEDHLGRPWVGLEGYPDSNGVRTFARRRLGALLEGCGLDRQRWFYPFPDYKMPVTIIPDGAYEEPDAVSFIDQVVGSPVAGNDSDPALLCDHRNVHRVMLEAGLGRDVANSFLVLASAGTPGHDADPDPGTLAWLFGNPRRRMWIRHQVVEGGATGRRIRTAGPGPEESERTDGWLQQNPVKDEDFAIGVTIWELAADACRRRDKDALKDALEPWRRFIDQRRTVAEDLENSHPFLLASTREILPPDHLDLCTSNFVVAGDRIDYIDREWIAEPAVDADLVMIRGLWLLAQHLVFGGGIHPWDPSLTVDELTIEIGGLLDLPVRDHLEQIYEAERALLELVTGRSRKKIDVDLAWLRKIRPTDPETIGTLPLARLREQIDTLLAERDSARGETERLRAELDRKRAELDRERAELGNVRGALDREHEERIKLTGALDREHEERINLTGALDREHEERINLTGALDRERTERARLEDELAQEREHNSQIGEQLSTAHQLLTEVGGKLEETAADLGTSEREIDTLRIQTAEILEQKAAESKTLHDQLDALETEATALRNWRASFEQRLPIRIWRRFQR